MVDGGGRAAAEERARVERVLRDRLREHGGGGSGSGRGLREPGDVGSSEH
jgi:hypothetical protein